MFFQGFSAAQSAAGGLGSSGAAASTPRCGTRATTSWSGALGQATEHRSVPEGQHQLEQIHAVGAQWHGRHGYRGAFSASSFAGFAGLFEPSSVTLREARTLALSPLPELTQSKPILRFELEVSQGQ
jgi:hypothetical protein